MYLEPEHAQSRITDCEFKELVVLPREIDLNEWLASNSAWGGRGPLRAPQFLGDPQSSICAGRAAAWPGSGLSPSAGSGGAGWPALHGGLGAGPARCGGQDARARERL